MNHYAFTLGTAAWNTKSVMGDDVEFVALVLMVSIAGSVLSRSNSTLRPFFSNTVRGGIPEEYI